LGGGRADCLLYWSGIPTEAMIMDVSARRSAISAMKRAPRIRPNKMTGMAFRDDRDGTVAVPGDAVGDRSLGRLDEHTLVTVPRN
jgi:hypothetical protein